MNDGFLSHVFIVQEGIIEKNLFTNEELNQKAIHISYVNFDKVEDEIVYKKQSDKFMEFVFWAYEEDINEYKNMYNLDYSIIENLIQTKSPSEKYKIVNQDNDNYIYFRIGESENEEIINQLTDIKFGEYVDAVIEISKGYVIDNNITYLAINLNDFINLLLIGGLI